MLPNNAFAPRGYIFNRKGFAITRYNNRDVAYILNIEDSSNGKRLVVETMVSDNNGPFIDNNIVIKPKIPYRIIMCDPTYISALEKTTAFSSQDNGVGLLFNPGLTLAGDGTVSGLPASSTFNDRAYIELNLDRLGVAEIPKLSLRTPMIWQNRLLGGTKIASTKSIALGNPDYKLQDSRASIIAINSGGNIDYLYIAVTTTVRQSGTLVDHNTVGSSAYMSLGTKTFQYSLPVLLLLEVDRTNLSSTETLPSAWRYLFPLEKWANPDLEKNSFPISIIDDATGGTFITKSWNYNVIPAKLQRETIDGVAYEYTAPLSRGCNWDVTYDAIGSRLFAMSAVANWERAKNRVAQRINWMAYNLADFSTSFSAETLGDQFSEKAFDVVVSHISGASNDTNILFAVTYGDGGTGAIGSNVLLYYFDASVGDKVSLTTLTKASHGYVEKFDDTFIFSCASNTPPFATDVYKCPPVATMAAWTSKLINKSYAIEGYKFAYKGYLNNSSKAVIGDFINAGDGFTVGFNRVTEDMSLFPVGYSQRNLDVRYVSNLFDSLIEIYHYPKVDYKYLRHDGIPNGNLFSLPSGVLPGHTHGTEPNELFRLHWDAKEQYIDTYRNADVNIDSGSGTMYYWTNSYLGSAQGISVILRIHNCSGVFRDGTGGTGDWGFDLGNGQEGIPVDFTKTRPDLLFSYSGNYEDFITSGGSGNYVARLVAPSFDLELLYGSPEQDITMKAGQTLSFVDYDINGSGTVDVHTFLDPDKLTNYEAPGFSLSNVKYKVTINTPDNIIGSGLVDITLPDPSATISSSGTIYKTITDPIPFLVTRDTSTYILDIQVENKGKMITTRSSYKDSITTSDTILVGLGSFNKGDYASISYMPAYLGQRSSATRPTSERVTNVRGHKYYISDVKIYIDSVEKTSDIASSEDPYLYTDVGVGTVPINVTFDIGHETFATNAYDDLTKVYPVISGTYMVVTPFFYPTPNRIFFCGGTEITVPLIERTSSEATTAYPNCTYEFANILYSIKYTPAAAGYKDTNSPGGSQIELTTESLTASAVATGKYQIYIIVEDEFTQRSAWCVTNINKKYEIPFK